MADTETAAIIAASRSLVAVAGIDGLQVWNAEGQLLTTLDIGAKLQATARTADGQWLTVDADNATGWAQATQVVAFDLADPAGDNLGSTGDDSQHPTRCRHRRQERTGNRSNTAPYACRRRDVGGKHG